MRFGFIGTGNMGGALARAARRKLAGEDLLLANRTEAKAAALGDIVRCRETTNQQLLDLYKRIYVEQFTRPTE